MTTIFIPGSVTHIGDGAFAECKSIDKISVDNENPVYDSRNDCNAIIETKTNTLIAGCKNTIIPDDILSIGADAFSYRRGMTNITIPDGVTSIGTCAFKWCRELSGISIPDSVTVIGFNAFERCEIKKIKASNSVLDLFWDSVGAGCRFDMAYNLLKGGIVCKRERPFLRKEKERIFDAIIKKDDAEAMMGFLSAFKKPTVEEIDNYLKKSKESHECKGYRYLNIRKITSLHLIQKSTITTRSKRSLDLKSVHLLNGENSL